MYKLVRNSDVKENIGSESFENSIQREQILSLVDSREWDFNPTFHFFKKNIEEKDEEDEVKEKRGISEIISEEVIRTIAYFQFKSSKKEKETFQKSLDQALNVKIIPKHIFLKNVDILINQTSQNFYHMNEPELKLLYQEFGKYSKMLRDVDLKDEVSECFRKRFHSIQVAIVERMIEVRLEEREKIHSQKRMIKRNLSK